MGNNTDCENSYGMIFKSKEDAEEYRELAAKFGELRRANMELLNRAGKPTFPNIECYVSYRSVQAFLEAERARFKEGSFVYSLLTDLIKRAEDSGELPVAGFLRRGIRQRTETGTEYCGCCGHIFKDETRRYCPNCGAGFDDDCGSFRKYTG